MILQIKVKVKIETLKEFAEKLLSGKLDRSAIISETYCEANDPSVGTSFWKVENMEEFEIKFSSWKQFYEQVEIKEVIPAMDAMKILFIQNK